MPLPACLTRARLTASAAALALVLAPLAAPADADTDTGREARLTVAEAYVTAMVADFDMDAMVRSMYRPMLAQLRAAGQEISDAQEAEIEALYLSEFREPMRELMLAQDKIMADTLTLSEIEALYAFYNTPAGRNVMQKLPQIVEAQMPATMALVETRMEVILPRLMEIID